MRGGYSLGMHCHGALAPLLLLACCDINGGQQLYPGASIYESPTRSFHFHFLAPPWHREPPPSEVLVYLAVSILSQFNLENQSISHHLQVTFGSEREARREADVAQEKATRDGRIISRTISSVTSLSGEQGWEFHAFKDRSSGRQYFRDSFFSDGEKRIVHFSLTSAYPLDDQDMNDLIFSFSAGPDPGTKVPPRVAGFALPDASTLGDAGADRSSSWH
jgi:hypothetical protein